MTALGSHQTHSGHTAWGICSGPCVTALGSPQTHTLYILPGVFAVASAVTAVISFVRYRWRKQKEEQKQVLDLVEKIIGK